MAKAARSRKQAPHTSHDHAEWLIGWRVALARQLLPTSWPAEAGGPHEGAVCSCCRTASWWHQPDPHGHDAGGWICVTCHPPRRGQQVRRWQEGSR